jgi:5-(carboxyamino)imidazole ribonucleotide mutase
MIKKVAIIMGSNSDYPSMKNAEEVLTTLGVEFDSEVVSAHRTPDKMFDFAKTAHEKYSVIIAGAGGAAHLPGMVAAMTHLPVFGVPIKSSVLSGKDSLLSIVQMPKGVAVGTLAIGDAGAFNAGLLASQVIALTDEKVRENLLNFRKNQTENILNNPNPKD